MLGLLLDAAKSGAELHQVDLHAHLGRLGQLTTLTRAQLLRIVNNLKHFCAQNQILGVQLHHLPRKASTGPWSVALSVPIVWPASGEGTPPQTASGKVVWPHPRLLKVASLQALTHFLQGLLTCEGFAMYGQNLEALETLPSSKSENITLECAGLLDLRRIDLLRRSGQTDKARQLATSMARSQSTATAALEPRLATQSAFALDRIKYDEDPIAAWPLLVDSPPPPRLLMPDPFTMGEWHNLSAIALRRAIVAQCSNSKKPTRSPQLSDASNGLFAKMMLHFDSALYMAMSHHRWDRLHAYLDNLSLCLQELLPFGFCKIEDVVACYEQALASADKLDSGNDDAWDMIFFGEFWLNHEAELKKFAAPGFIHPALPNNAFRPDQKQYWVRLLERIKQGAAPRQLGIALVLFTRWATQHRDSHQHGACTNELLALFEKNPELRKRLSSEGYSKYLPTVPSLKSN